MIHFVEDTVFNTNAEWIVNTVNCVGVMGKGLALEFALRYPKLKDIYTDQCRKKQIRVGYIYSYKIDNTLIINFPTKYDYKYPSRYEWIEKGLINFVNQYKNLGIKSIAFPYLGCSNGELDSNQVLKIMEKYLSLDDVEVYICSSRKLDGKEKEMLDNLKAQSIENLIKIGKLNVTQREIFEEKYHSLTRFYQILDIPKIGLKTYERFFNYFYNNNQEEKVEQEQLTLF